MSTVNDIIHNRIEEIETRLRTGNTKQKFKIGASEMTNDQWDNLLSKVDEFEADFKEVLKQEAEKAEQKAEMERMRLA